MLCHFAPIVERPVVVYDISHMSSRKKSRFVSTAREFLREREGSAKPKDMLRYLRRAPKVAPA